MDEQDLLTKFLNKHTWEIAEQETKNASNEAVFLFRSKSGIKKGEKKVRLCHVFIKIASQNLVSCPFWVVKTAQNKKLSKIMLNRSNPFTVQHFHLFTNYQFVFGGLRMFFLRIFGDLALFCFFQCFSSCFKFLILKIKKCKAIFPQLSYARVSPTQLYRIIWVDPLRPMMIKVSWFSR